MPCTYDGPGRFWIPIKFPAFKNSASRAHITGDVEFILAALKDISGMLHCLSNQVDIIRENLEC